VRVQIARGAALQPAACGLTFPSSPSLRVISVSSGAGTFQALTAGPYSFTLSRYSGFNAYVRQATGISPSPGDTVLPFAFGVPSRHYYVGLTNVVRQGAQDLVCLRGAAVVLDAWLRVRGPVPGRLFRPINHGGRIHGQGLTPQAVYNMLVKQATHPKIAHASPHDLRRSFVVICAKGGHQNAVDRQRARSGGVVTPETLEPGRQPT